MKGIQQSLSTGQEFDKLGISRPVDISLSTPDGFAAGEGAGHFRSQ